MKTLTPNQLFVLLSVHLGTTYIPHIQDQSQKRDEVVHELMDTSLVVLGDDEHLKITFLGKKYIESITTSEQ